MLTQLNSVLKGEDKAYGTLNNVVHEAVRSLLAERITQLQ